MRRLERVKERMREGMGERKMGREIVTAAHMMLLLSMRRTKKVLKVLFSFIPDRLDTRDWIRHQICSLFLSLRLFMIRLLLHYHYEFCFFKELKLIFSSYPLPPPLITSCRKHFINFEGLQDALTASAAKVKHPLIILTLNKTWWWGTFFDSSLLLISPHPVEEVKKKSFFFLTTTWVKVPFSAVIKEVFLSSEKGSIDKWKMVKNYDCRVDWRFIFDDTIQWNDDRKRSNDRKKLKVTERGFEILAEIEDMEHWRRRMRWQSITKREVIKSEWKGSWRDVMMSSPILVMVQSNL